jgi:hypothetical protein
MFTLSSWGAFYLCARVSFIRVNVFLLIVYPERQKNTSYELMMSRVGGDIIRMYEMEEETIMHN